MYNVPNWYSNAKYQGSNLISLTDIIETIIVIFLTYWDSWIYNRTISL